MTPGGKRPLTVARPELLDGASDARFRDLLYDLFAFGNRLGTPVSSGGRRPGIVQGSMGRCGMWR